MTKAQLAKKADQLLSQAVRLEHIVNSLPSELVRDRDWKEGLTRLIERVERAAQ